MPRNSSKHGHKVEVRIKPRPKEPAEPASALTDMGQWFESLRHDMESLFRPWLAIPPTEAFRGGWRLPRTDVVDEGDHYEVRAEVPGIPKDRIEVTVAAGRLDIRADAGTDTERKGKNYYYHETGRRAFYRSLALPPDADDAGVVANLEDGCLSLTIPKREGTGSGRKIPVS